MSNIGHHSDFQNEQNRAYRKAPIRIKLRHDGVQWILTDAEDIRYLIDQVFEKYHAGQARVTIDLSVVDL